ncbi:MAG: hypothetical protein ACKVOP_03360 [Sphingomonadaceae bacterium]
MPNFTINEWVIVVLVLVAGYLLGLLSRSGAGKWQRQYEDERDAHQALRRDYDLHLKRLDDVRATTMIDRDRDGIDDRAQGDARRIVDRDGDGVNHRAQVRPVKSR